MRPRSVGTFLISRPETSAKLSARPRMRSMSSRVRSSIDSRCRFTAPSPLVTVISAGTEITTSSSPSSSSTFTYTRSLRAVGRFLPT